MATKYKCEQLKSGNIRTCEVRLAYVNLLRPRANNNGGKPKYSVAALFPKGADIKLLQKAAEAAGREKFADKFDTLLKAGKLRMPFKDQGENNDDEGELRDGFQEGCVFISASANEDRRPPVVGPDLSSLTESNEVYSGMWARISIRPFAYDTDGNRGVSFGLQAVQKIGDDDPLGGGGPVNVEKEFEAVDVESSDDVFAELSF